MKNLKYLLFILPFFFSINVFAKDYDVSNIITSPVAPSDSGTYTGTELNGASSSWNINTRYQGTLQNIRFNIPKPAGIEGDCFWTNMTYKVTMNMATNDWRNNFGSVKVAYSSSSSNLSSGKVTFVSRQKIYFTFKIPTSDNTCYQHVYVDLPSSELFTVFTGETNWNLKSVILSDELSAGSSSGSGSGTGSTPTPTPDSSQNIINNANQNTQDIITNNNSNTSDIIDNANQNFSNLNDNISANSISEINTQRSIILSNCTNAYDFNIKKGYRISNSNTLIPDENSYYTDGYVGIGSNVSKVYIQNPLNSTSGYLFIFYDSSNNIISYVNTRSQTLNVPTGAIYFRFASTSSNTYVFRETRCITSTDVAKDEIKQNQNENTQKEIDSQRVCKQIDVSSSSVLNHVLSSTGSLVVSNYYNVTDYINIKNSTVKKLDTYNGSAYFCYYDLNKSLISCTINSSVPINTYLDIPSNAEFVRFTIDKTANKPRYEVCKNGNQVINDSLDNLNDNITNSNVDSGTGTDFFDDFTSQDFGLSQIITIPLNTIQSLTSKSCVPLSVPIPFTNSNVNLPCMTEIYENKFSSIYNLWKIVSFGIVSYLIAIDIFHIVKGFKDPESDKVEVLDL